MHQGKGVHQPPGAIGSPKGGQGLHLGICHPEPPIVAHWGLLCWFLPLQRVCKGESRVQAVSWLCLTGDGDHMQGCVATLGHRQARELLAETDFASPFQAASRSKTKSTGSCCVLPAPGTHSQKCLHSSLGGHCLEAPWKAKCQDSKGYKSGSKEGCWLATAFSAGRFHVGEIPGRLQFLSSRFRNGEVVAMKFGG